MAVRALTFDTYGTVVDWRSSVLAELAAFGAGRGLDVDWATFLADWKSGYRPGMDRVNRGEWPWTRSKRFTGGAWRSSFRPLRAGRLGRCRSRPPDRGVVAPAPLARCRSRPPAAPRAVHPLAAVERQLRRDAASRAVRGATVGLHHHGRERSLLQAAARGLPDSRHAAGSACGRGHDGRGAQLRSSRCARVRPPHGVRPASGRARAGTAVGPRPDARWDIVATDFIDLAGQLET